MTTAGAEGGRRVRYDELAAMIEDVMYSGAFTRAWVREGRRATRFLVRHAGTSHGRAASLRLLDEVQAVAEQRISRIARRYSFDLLQAIVRRFPPYAVSNADWLSIAIPSLEKGATGAPDATVIRTSSGHALQTRVSVITIVNAFRIAALASLIADIAGVRRTVGKGGQFRPTVDNPLHFTTEPDLRAALDHYDRRRNAEYAVFAEQGVAVLPGASDEQGVVLLAWPVRRPLYYHVPERDFSLLASYVLHPLSMEAVWATLEPYRAAIEHVHAVKLEDIAHVLASLAAKVLYSLRAFVIDGRGMLTLEPTGSAAADDHQLGFTYALLATASLRRDRSEWVRELGAVSTPWYGDVEEAEGATRRFLESFLYSPGEPTLDVVPGPRPLLIRGVADTVYFDVGATGGWLGWLLETAQDWFASQHGDRFHLAVTQLLMACPAVRTITPHWSFTDSQGRSRQGDLLVETDDAVFTIECKAWRKSAAYLAGVPSTLTSRAASLAKAMEQVREAANAVKAGRAVDRTTDGRRVEHVICTPTPEFIRPLDRYGLLSSGLPRICTPAELIGHLNRTNLDPSGP